MNAQLKILAALATTYIEPTPTSGEGWVFDKEKFAELIIKECANFVENVFDDDGGHATCEDYAKGIKQHFGVEE